MLYLMLVVVFSRVKEKWWFFLILGWGKCNRYPIMWAVQHSMSVVVSVYT